jgi:hypothetical protein
MSIDNKNRYFHIYKERFNSFSSQCDNSVVKTELSYDNIEKTFIRFGTLSQPFLKGNKTYFIFNNLRKDDNEQIHKLLPHILKWTDKVHSCVEEYLHTDIPILQKALVLADQKDIVLKQLDTSRELLLAGPPHHNTYTIDHEKAHEWVHSQKSPHRQLLAQKLLENIRYIPHTELLDSIRICVHKVYLSLVSGAPITFLIPKNTNKSNFYISLLFLHFWQEAGYPIDFIIRNTSIQYLYGNIIDVDDMAYSGNQTSSILGSIYRTFMNELLDKIIDKCKIDTDEDFRKAWKYMPRYIPETHLQKHKVNYIVTRIYMSEYSFNNYMSPEYLSFPIRLVTAHVIPFMPDIDSTMRDEIRRLFKVSENSHVSVYFNHKVANNASTFLYPLALGIVPESQMAADELLINNIIGNGIEMKPFIHGCDTNERLHKIRTRTRRNIIDNIADEYRCPYAWYKKINYNRGVYVSKGGNTPSPSKSQSKSPSKKNKNMTHTTHKSHNTRHSPRRYTLRTRTSKIEEKKNEVKTEVRNNNMSPVKSYERLSQHFVDEMYKNMWQFFNKDTIMHILIKAGCSDIGISRKKKVDDDNFSNSKYYNTICIKGPPEEGHYVFIDNFGNITGTYENNLIDENDDGICHGGALSAALRKCGHPIEKLNKNPGNNNEMNKNYEIILNTYKMIIDKGWWDDALKTYFYSDVSWTSNGMTTVQTIAARKILEEYIIK